MIRERCFKLRRMGTAREREREREASVTITDVTEGFFFV